MRRVRLGISLALVGAFSAVIVGCSGGSGSGQTGASSVTIVSDLPLQGENRADAASMVNAIKLAIRQRDGKAGDVGIDYKSMDDATPQTRQWDEARCAENAQKAAQDDDVVGWIGPFNSGCAAIEIPILNRARLAMISPANTYIGLTKPGGEPGEPEEYYPTDERNYSRVIVADDKQAKAGVALMQEEGLDSVYILHDQEPYGTSLADQFERTAREQGMDVLGREGIDGSEPDYRTLMNEIKQKDPDAIYFGGIIENNAAQLIRDKVGAGMGNDDVAFIGPDGIYVDAMIGQAGDAAEGVYVTFGGLPDSELPPEGQEFVETYESRYGGHIQPHTAYAYEAANVMLDAIERAADDGDVDRDEVIQEIYTTHDYEGVLGTWSFDDEGDTSLTEVSVRKVENGRFELYDVLDVADL